MSNRWTRVIVVLLAGVSAMTMLQAQARGPIELRNLLRDRFDVVALQQGVALVPRQSGSSIRMIEIVDGVVSIDGETLTGKQLQDKLGRDADLILQVSYLDRDAQRTFAGSDVSGSSSPATPQPPLPPPPLPERSDTSQRSRTSYSDRVRIGGSITVAKDERVDGDVVAIMGPANIDGEVTGEVTVVMGPLTLGPQSIVRRDVTVVGGPLSRAPGSQVLGKINEVGIDGVPGGRAWTVGSMFGPFWSRVGSLAATVFRVTFMILIGLLAVALGRGSIERIAARTAASPVRSGLIGLAAEILFLPVLVMTVIVLAVSIIGIPLLVLVPFAMLAVGLLALVGFISLAYHVGRLLTARFGWADRGGYAAVAIGVVAIAGVTLFAKLAALAGGFLIGAPLTALGYLIEYVAWTIGFGATILAWYETQTRFGSRAHTAAPPPLPSEG